MTEEIHIEQHDNMSTESADHKTSRLMVQSDMLLLIISLTPFFLFRCGTIEAVLVALYIVGSSAYILARLRSGTSAYRAALVSALFYYSCFMMYLAITYVYIFEDYPIGSGIWEEGTLWGIVLLLLVLVEMSAFSILPLVFFVRILNACMRENSSIK